MKRVLTWIEEEKIVLLIILLAVGILLSELSGHIMLGGMLIYGAIIIAALSAGHSLYLKFK